MQGSKVYVQKRGEVYTVPVDPATNQPIAVTSVSDDLPGFPFTCIGVAELQASFPNREFIFLEPKSEQASVPLEIPESVRSKAAELLKSHGLSSPPPKPQLEVKVESVGIAAESQRIVEQMSLGPKGRADEFLKRLKTALQYASKKHEKKLQDQIAIVEELIREVF